MSSYRPDILTCLANLSSDEVFTPPVVANKMLDLLPSEVWSNPNLTWLDPGCKSGVILREIAVRLMKGLEEKIPEESKRRQHILEKMLWGIPITEITGLVGRRTLYCSKDASGEFSNYKAKSHHGNIYSEETTHTFKNGKCTWCGAPEEGTYEKDPEEDDPEEGDEDIEPTKEFHAYQFIHETALPKNFPMKIDIIVTNPPYQLKTGGYGAQAKPIYHLFVEQAKKMAQHVIMIIPSRWFAGGMGLQDFRKNMLNDEQIRTLVDIPNAGECFPGVEIKGGVCYFLWSKGTKGECEVITKTANTENKLKRKLNAYETFVRFNQAIPILEKIKNKGEKSVETLVLPINYFNLPTNHKMGRSGDIKLYGQKETGLINLKDLPKGEEITKKWKVLLAKAGEGSGEYPNRILGKPLLAEPNSACTMTYIVAGNFNTKTEAENFIKYIKTRFFRFLVALKKNTQDVNQAKFEFVPLLPMTEEWTDEKLYKRYGITKAEQDFIESLIKEMP
jgi:site-specific DNA-methyltransferase (adenine-specific)